MLVKRVSSFWLSLRLSGAFAFGDYTGKIRACLTLNIVIKYLDIVIDYIILSFYYFRT